MQLARLIRNGIILIAILFAVDRSVGYVLDQMFYKQTHGDDANTAYVAGKVTEDILIFGSSRASHHYIPNIIEQATGYSCFNAGRDEMTILYLKALLPIIYNRYTPQIIILEIVPTELAKRPENDAAVQRVSTVLLPFTYQYPTLLPTVALVSRTEKLKYYASRIYAYNSLVGSIIQNAYTNIGHTSDKGYEPLTGTIDSSRYQVPMWKGYEKNYPLDTLLVNTLEDIFILTKQKGTKLVITISPFYFPFDMRGNTSYQTIVEMAKANDVPLYDFSLDTRFLKHPGLFKDDVHLNDSGARVYSRIISDILPFGK